MTRLRKFQAQLPELLLLPAVLGLVLALLLLMHGPLYAQDERAGEVLETALMRYGWNDSEARRLSAELNSLVAEMDTEAPATTDVMIAARALAANRKQLSGAGDAAGLALELALISAELRRAGLSTLESARTAADGLRSAMGRREAASVDADSKALDGRRLANEVREAVQAQAARRFGHSFAETVRERLNGRGIRSGFGMPGVTDPDTPNDIPGGSEDYR